MESRTAARFMGLALLLLTAAACDVGSVGNNAEERSSMEALGELPALTAGHCVVGIVVNGWGKETGQCLDESLSTGICRIFESAHCIKGRFRPVLGTPALCVTAGTTLPLIDDATCADLGQ